MEFLGTLNNWNIIKFNNKDKSKEDFDEVSEVIPGGIS